MDSLLPVHFSGILKLGFVNPLFPLIYSSPPPPSFLSSPKPHLPWLCKVSCVNFLREAHVYHSFSHSVLKLSKQNHSLCTGTERDGLHLAPEGKGSPLTMLSSHWYWITASSISSASTSLASLKHQTLVYRRDETVPTCIHPTFQSQTWQDGETHLFSIPKHIYFLYLKNQTCLYSKGKLRKDQVFMV